jgi:aryl-alcohol dehydrogenase-like predicted oxidoreductase
MRLSTDDDRDESRALATIDAAVEAGITVFDTARTYGRDETELGHNERLLARALRASGATRARIVTKGGMARAGGAWIPDGRAKSIRADCEASLEALGGLPIDLYLVHAPDPRTPWRTTLRALARLVDDGLVPRVGVANVNRTQLDEALAWAPIAAVQVALSHFDDTALRGGVLERCEGSGIALLAHSPLGGVKRAGRLAGDDELVEAAATHGATPAEVALAQLLELSPVVVPLPGARRPETARSAASAARLELPRPARRRKAAPRAQSDADVVLVMGIQGAGKSLLAAEHVARGYVRLNRDERGGTLRELAAALDELLGADTTRVILDNTYLTRAQRNEVVEVARRHGAAVRCLWLDAPLAQAQVNVVMRLLERFGSLPGPEELRTAARSEPGVLTPTRQMRAFRELEPPALDEGFASVERVPFVRVLHDGRPGVFVSAGALAQSFDPAQGDPAAPHLVFDWSAAGDETELRSAAERLSESIPGVVEHAACPHPGGPPTCWCRPPLPGLPLAFARTHGVDPARSLLVGSSPAHRTLANLLGARYLDAA